MLWSRLREGVLEKTGVRGEDVLALALDTTGSSVVMVDDALKPLDDYYLWCDHRAHREAQEITAKAHERKLEAIDWCGGVYSHEWGLGQAAALRYVTWTRRSGRSLPRRWSIAMWWRRP